MAIQTSLEMSDSGYAHPSIQYLKTICVEDKFPQGQQMIRDILMAEKGIKKVTLEVAGGRVAMWAKKVASLPSDRHVAWLCKVALYSAIHNVQSDIPEVQMATEIENIILRVPRHGERPTPNDITEREGFDRIQELLGKLHYGTEVILWHQFKEMWKKSPKLTCRLYLYTLVANRFHPGSEVKPVSITSKEMERKSFEIPDARDTHASKRKRVIVGAQEGYEKRQKIQEMNAKSSRTKARNAFNTLSSINGETVLQMKQTQKPCGNKPCSWIVTTETGDYFVKGPVEPEKVQFQIDIDREKEQHGIKPMNIELIKEGNLHYLYAPAFNGCNASPHIFYGNGILWNIVKVLIFRHAYNISDTNLRNIMVAKNDVLSVDEMSNARVKPAVDNLLSLLFSKGKIPRKLWRTQLVEFIDQHRDKFITECKKYGERTIKLIQVV